MVEAVSWDDDLDALLDRAAEVREDDAGTDPGWHLTGSPGTVRTDDGVVGTGESYESAADRVRLVAFLHDGIGAVVVASGSEAERPGLTPPTGRAPG